MRDTRSEYEYIDSLMKVRPVEAQPKTHYPFSDVATLLLRGVYTKKQITERRRATYNYRYSRPTKAKKVTRRLLKRGPRVRKISESDYVLQAQEQDARARNNERLV